MVDAYGYYRQGLLDDGVELPQVSGTDFLRGAKYAPFDLLGAPVDLANMALSPLGLGSDMPVGGSDYLINKYADLGDLLGINYDRPTGSGSELLGRIGAGVISPAAIMTALAKTPVNMSKSISAFRDARQLRMEAAEAASQGNAAKANEANVAASVLEVEAAPLTSVLQRIDADGKVPEFTVKDDGTYLTVRSSLADPSEGAETVARARKDISAGDAAAKGDQPLSASEVRFIVQSPELNSARQFGDSIAIAVNDAPLDAALLKGETGFAGRESSVAKQAAIGRAFSLAVEGSPEYKAAVFEAYGKRYPNLLEAVGAKNYDDLVQKSYKQMEAETEAQFNRLPVNTFYHPGDFEYVTSAGGTNSIAMLRDINQARNLNVFRGGDPHEFLSRIDPQTGLSSNEKFRAVHDYAGHGIFGNKFDALGEERAFGVHSQMYSPLARFAMASETRGQNSFVNYSPLNVDLEAEIASKMDELQKVKTDADKQAILAQIQDLNSQRLYGDQKAVLLPPEMVDLSYQGGMPEYLRGVNVPSPGTTVDDVPFYHFSKTGGILELDPSFAGSRMGRGGDNYAAKEAESLRAYDRPNRVYAFADKMPKYEIDPAMKGADFVYRGKASGLYDREADLLGLNKLATQRNVGATDPYLYAKDFENAVKDYGYSGVVAPFAGQRAALLYEPVPVTPYKGLLK